MNLIILQSRNGSKRLPFKSSLSLGGIPTLIHIIKRLKRYKDNNFEIVLATSTNIEDLTLEGLCKLNNIKCFRGDPTNVFSRFKALANEYNPELIVRITGDCPFIYSPLINSLIQIMNENKNIDYATNTLKRTFPHGHDVEIFKANLLFKKNDLNSFDIEHVTPFMYKSGEFKTYSYELKQDFSDIRITLDNKEDYFFLDSFINQWVYESSTHDLFDIIKPEIYSDFINKHKILEILHKKAKFASEV